MNVQDIEVFLDQSDQIAILSRGRDWWSTRSMTIM